MDPPPMRRTTHRTQESRILTPGPAPGAHRARPVMTECRPVRDGAAVPTPDGLYRPTAPVEPGRPGHLAHLAQRVGHRRRRSFVASPRGIIDRSRPHQTQRPSPDPTASTPGGYHKGDQNKRPGRRRPRASCCHLPPPRLERTDRNYSTTRPGPAPDAPAGGPPATPGLPSRGSRVQGGPQARRDSADPGCGPGREYPPGGWHPGGVPLAPVSQGAAPKGLTGGGPGGRGTRPSLHPPPPRRPPGPLRIRADLPCSARTDLWGQVAGPHGGAANSRVAGPLKPRCVEDLGGGRHKCAEL